MPKKTYEERLAEIRAKQADLELQAKKIKSAQRAEKNKARTKRLIELGAILESEVGEIADSEKPKWAAYCKAQRNWILRALGRDEDRQKD